MKEYNFNISTDTSAITAILESEIYKINRTYAQEKIPMTKGKYLVSLEWEDLKYTEFVEVKKETDYLLLGDALYYSRKKFKKYDRGANLYGLGANLDIGGDGSFDIKVTIEEIDYLPENKYLIALERAKNIYGKAKKVKRYEDMELIKELKKEFKNDKLIMQYSYSEKIGTMLESFSLLYNKVGHKKFIELMDKFKNS